MTSKTLTIAAATAASLLVPHRPASGADIVERSYTFCELQMLHSRLTGGTELEPSWFSSLFDGTSGVSTGLGIDAVTSGPQASSAYAPHETTAHANPQGPPPGDSPPGGGFGVAGETLDSGTETQVSVFPVVPLTSAALRQRQAALSLFLGRADNYAGPSSASACPEAAPLAGASQTELLQQKKNTAALEVVLLRLLEYASAADLRSKCATLAHAKQIYQKRLHAVVALDAADFVSAEAHTLLTQLDTHFAAGLNDPERPLVCQVTALDSPSYVRAQIKEQVGTALLAALQTQKGKADVLVGQVSAKLPETDSVSELLLSLSTDQIMDAEERLAAALGNLQTVVDDALSWDAVRQELEEIDWEAYDAKNGLQTPDEIATLEAALQGSTGLLALLKDNLSALQDLPALLGYNAATAPSACDDLETLVDALVLLAVNGYETTSERNAFLLVYEDCLSLIALLTAAEGENAQAEAISKLVDELGKRVFELSRCVVAAMRNDGTPCLSLDD